MKNRLTRIAVLLLCLSMVLTSQTGFFAYAAEEVATHEAAESTAEEEPKGETSPEKGKESNQKDAATPAPEKPQPVKSLQADNADRKDKDAPAISVAIENKDGFPGDSQAEITLIEKENDISALTSAIQKETKTKSDLKSLLAIEISIKQGKNEIETGTTSKVSLTATGAEDLSDSVLYHQKKDGSFEELKFEHKSDKDVQTVEFETSAFSPFIFVTEEKKETSEETTIPDPEEPLLRTPLLKAAGTKTLYVHSTDYNGTTLTPTEIGSGYDLYFYELPASALSLSAENLSTLDPAALANMIKGSMTDFSEYRQHISINSQDKALTLTLEADASAENPYVLVFMGDEASSARLNNTGGYPASVIRGEWFSTAAFYYDAENVNIIGSSATDNDGTYTFNVKHDTSVVRPKVTVNIDTSAYTPEAGETIFPQTLFPSSLCTNSTVTKDGEYTFEFNYSISRNAINEGLSDGEPLIMGGCPVILSGSNWVASTNDDVSNSLMSRSHHFLLTSVDENGNILGLMDPDGSGSSELSNEKLIISLTKKNIGQKPKVKYHLEADESVFDDTDLPLYLRIEVIDCSHTDWTDSKVIEITKQDLNKDKICAFDRFDPYLEEGSGYSGNPLNFVFSVYKDAECTELDTDWGNGGSMTYSWIYESDGDGLWAGRGWYYDETTGEETYRYDVPLSINYSLIKPSIPYTAFTNNSSQMYPAYMKVSGFDQEKIVELTGNGEGSVEFDKISLRDAYGCPITWSVYSDPECSTLHDGWKVNNEDITVYWDTSSKKLCNTNNGQPAVISLERTQTQRIVIPLDTVIGDLDENELFPAYITVILADRNDNFTPVVVKKELNSLQDANGDLVFEAAEGEAFTTVSEYTVSAVVSESREDNMTFKPTWLRGTLDATLQADGKLHQGLSELRLSFRPVSVNVRPDLFKMIPDDATHVYLKTWAGAYPVKTDFREITDRSELKVDFPFLALVNTSVNAQSMLTEDPDADALTQSQTELATSKGTYFYSSAGQARVSPSGSLVSGTQDFVLTPYETNKAFETFDVPVKINIPENGVYTFSNGNYSAAYLNLFSVDPETGEMHSEVAYDDYYYGDRYTTAFVNVNSIAPSYEGSINVRPNRSLKPGTYYMNYGISNRSGSSVYDYDSNIDFAWTHERNVKVILTQDGQLTWENGDPVVLNFDYAKCVLPNLDVHTELPDGSAAYDGNSYQKNLSRTGENSYTPTYFQYTLRPFKNVGNYYSGNVYFRTGALSSTDMVQNIPEGDSVIGSPLRRFNYLQDLYYRYINPDAKPSDFTYDDVPVIASSYRRIVSGSSYGESATVGYESQRNYADEEVEGYPVGDYYLTYTTGKNSDIRKRWYSETSLHVHYAEDGKFYRIKEDGTYEDEPYVMQIRYIGNEAEVVDSLKIKVNTIVKDGVSNSKAFTAGDTFVVMVSEFRNGNADERIDYYAVGTAEITEAGLTEVELHSPGGGGIALHKNSQYMLSYGTFHEWTGNFDTSTVNRSWPIYNNLNVTFNNGMYIRSSTNHPSTWYPVYFTPNNVDEDGYIKGFTYNEAAQNADVYINRTDDTEGEVATFSNYNLIVPWEKSDPGKIGQASGEEATVYRPLSELSSIREKGNYIIAVQNKLNNKWYALYYDENGGHSIELEDVHSFEDLQAGYEINVDTKYNKLVFQATKVTQGSDSVSLQLKTLHKNAAGKYMALKMGQSSDVTAPLISDSAGTVIIRKSNADNKFTVSKGNYSDLFYLDELYGYSGFKTVSNKFGPYFGEKYTDYVLFGTIPYRYDSIDDYFYRESTTSLSYGGKYYTGDAAIYAGVNDNHPAINAFMADVDQEYLNDQYINTLRTTNNSYPGIGTFDFYILSDDIEEAPPVEQTNKYTRVKTYGDFVQTYVTESSKQSASMLLVYTDNEGKEYAMEAEKLFRVESKAGGSGYSTITTVADHILIPNNNSGTSQNFSIDSVEVKEDGTFVFATPYAFRRSRQNNTDDKNYMTLNGEEGGSAWTKNDDASHGESLVYVLHPTSEVHSQADWDVAQSYKLSVVRNGVTKWLGVTEADGIKQMSIVDSESDAVEFKVYTDQLSRYYSSAYGTDLYRYYKVNNLTDINAGDEILIVYNDEGTKKLVSLPFVDNGKYEDVSSSSYSIRRNTLAPAIHVLPEYSNVDTRDSDTITSESKYRYRMGTSEYLKKPYAYIDPENDEIIWAQGVSANAIGTAKSESNKQRKYASVTPLGNTTRNLYIKTGYDIYRDVAAETNFFPGPNEGEFYIRGGKSDAWLGLDYYQRYLLSIETGNYEYVGHYLTFGTVGTDDRVAVEVYRRPSTDEMFQIRYYSPEDELEHTETKPQETFSLTQKQDIEKDGVKYIFVGYTANKAKGGYLSLADSANLYDYDDIAKVASVKDQVRTQYELLGDCNPEGDNLIDYETIEDKVQTVEESGVTTTVLNVYPVYAVKGYSAAVAANDGDTMIIGASDFKDIQGGATGTTNDKERWLGSINIEVYKDGVLWVPGAGGSTTGRKKLFGAGRNASSATLYFAYHNDNAADLNIKFIADGITAETLYEYMSSSEFNTTEPSENYTIDAVWAEQGGSEDGLKYRYNWMSSSYGGQLDNVKGGSTVKIYVTTKYQVKYYFDDGNGSGYQQLTDAPWNNNGLYVTPGTRLAVENLLENSTSYLVKAGNEYDSLISPTPTSGNTFKDSRIIRGEYSQFLYEFEEYDEEFDVPVLPEAPAGKHLTKDKWELKNADMTTLLNVNPESVWQMQGTSYGTGNTIYAYKGASDQENTYHLYAAVEQPLPVPTGVGKTSYAALILMAVAGVLLAVNKKRRAAEK